MNRCPSGLFFDDVAKYCTFKDEARCGPLPASEYNHLYQHSIIPPKVRFGGLGGLCCSAGVADGEDALGWQQEIHTERTTKNTAPVHEWNGIERWHWTPLLCTLASRCANARACAPSGSLTATLILMYVCVRVCAASALCHCCMFRRGVPHRM